MLVRLDLLKSLHPDYCVYHFKLLYSKSILSVIICSICCKVCVCLLRAVLLVLDTDMMLQLLWLLSASGSNYFILILLIGAFQICRSFSTAVYTLKIALLQITVCGQNSLLLYCCYYNHKRQLFTICSY